MNRPFEVHLPLLLLLLATRLDALQERVEILLLSLLERHLALEELLLLEVPPLLELPRLLRSIQCIQYTSTESPPLRNQHAGSWV